jgi:hypothetical protein
VAPPRAQLANQSAWPLDPACVYMGQQRRDCCSISARTARREVTCPVLQRRALIDDIVLALRSVCVWQANLPRACALVMAAT